MAKPPEWMPVFVVLPATTEVSAALEEGKRVKTSKTRSGQDYWQRIGTAFPHKDGSIRVHLTACPVNGRLIIRPPGAGERLDPTAR